jgi:hypothetical protein
VKGQDLAQHVVITISRFPEAAEPVGRRTVHPAERPF